MVRHRILTIPSCRSRHIDHDTLTVVHCASASPTRQPLHSLFLALCIHLRMASLIDASKAGDIAAATQLLAEPGYPVDARDSAGRTALHEASVNGSLELVRLLLANNADVNLQVRCCRRWLAFILVYICESAGVLMELCAARVRKPISDAGRLPANTAHARSRTQPHYSGQRVVQQPRDPNS